ncbi:MAG: amino acid ABC transporter permease [Pseudaminobacter sp.]
MSLEWSVIWEYRYAFGSGVLLTIFLTVVTMLISVPAGIALAVAQFYSGPILRIIIRGFVEFFRCTPLILLLYWAFYVLPVMTAFSFSALTTALVGLCLNVSSYNSETFRAGITSIRRGQSDAALALGMTEWQSMRRIVLPQAIIRVMPILASTWVSLFKNTSLVSVISLSDLAYTALSIRMQTFRVLEVLTAMAVLYWLLGYPQAKLVDWIYRRWGTKE